MIRIRKNPASDAMNAHIATTPLSSDCSVVLALDFFFAFFLPDACSRSQSGRRPVIGGTRSKFSCGGGDVVAHSSVHASQGFAPARLPLIRLRRMFTAKT